MNEKFLITKYIKTFILNLDDMIVNMPKKELYMKDKLLDTSLEVLYLVYEANYITDKTIKKEKQIKLLSKIHLLDFYIERLYEKKYISEKVCLKKSNELLKISKMVYKWINESKSSATKPNL